MAALDAGNLGALIGEFTTNCVHADSMSKIAAMDRVITAFKEGNFDLETEVSLIGMKTPLQTKINAPKAILMPLNPLVIDQATLKINMMVASHEQSESSLDSHSEVAGKATVGFGLFKASMSIKASVGVHKSNQRSSDQRSSCEAELVMRQGEAAEGVSRLVDAVLDTVDKGLDLNAALIDSQAKKLKEEVTANGDSNQQSNEQEEAS